MAEESKTELAVAKLFTRFSNQIEALERELKQRGIQSNMSVAQRLPRHLRRRAASHNPKRVPRSVREKFAEARAKKEAAEKAKKKLCRRYRRKPANLRTVYLKRQARIRWLSTHIWHAKRYRMVERWGFKLPLNSCDKGLKASIRALKTESIMMDTSFTSIIEITGPNKSLIGLLDHFVPKQLGRPYSQTSFWTGSRHCSVILYDSEETFPAGALGHCSLILPPQTTQKLWITSIHPLLTTSLIHKLSGIATDLEVEEITHQLSSFRFFGCKVALTLSRALGLEEKCLENRAAGFYSVENVDDPRPRIPIKITPVASASYSVSNMTSSLDNFDSPSIFDANIRLNANKSRIADHLMSSRLKSPTQPDRIKKLVKIPILISRSSNFTDVIVPAAWATAFWIAFVYNGARTGGLRELESLPCELNSFAGASAHWQFWPDSQSADLPRIEAEQLDYYQKRPPAKRVNYRKLGILRPFYFPWLELVKFWAVEFPQKSFSPICHFYVLREFMVLKEINDDLNRKLHIRREIVHQHRCAIIPVVISAAEGGTPRPYGLICLPGKNDANNEEPMHNPGKFYVPVHSNDASFTLHSNSLKILGFVISGGYSHVAGHGRAIGFVSLLALDVLLRCRETNLVQFRNASERKYWPGKLEIIVNQKL